ncbi:hypothetical protein ACEPPN_000604 [Leptodophora sp. 'Broadleaf-Isolate-01']
MYGPRHLIAQAYERNPHEESTALTPAEPEEWPELVSRIRYVKIEGRYGYLDADWKIQRGRFLVAAFTVYQMPDIKLEYSPTPAIPCLSKNLVESMKACLVALEECRRNHHKCPHDDASLPLPCRVLHVGHANDSHIRLYVSNPTEKKPYLALSYCWGGDQPIKLTQLTLESMRTGITLSTLPKTIRDAVYVTRSLGIEYLWIDALCIIQDSQEDKEREIANMGHIYKNALLAIIAISAGNVHDGFLDRSELAPGCIRLPFLLPDRRLTDIGLLQTSSISGSAQTWPLHTRGWSLQEFVLSQRKLIFLPDEIIWLCLSVPGKPLLYSHITYQDLKLLPILPDSEAALGQQADEIASADSEANSKLEYGCWK